MSGTVRPLPLKPVPEVVICEMVRFAVPVLLIAIDCVPLLPTVMLPKATFMGLAVSCAMGAAAPVPVSVKFVGEFEAVLTSETLPVAVPVTDGAKSSVREVVAPAASVKGRLSPVAL